MKMTLEVLADGRPVKTKNGQRYVHDMLWRTPNGAYVALYWSESQLSAGNYQADGFIEVRNGNFTVTPQDLRLQN